MKFFFSTFFFFYSLVDTFVKNHVLNFYSYVKTL